MRLALADVFFGFSQILAVYQSITQVSNNLPVVLSPKTSNGFFQEYHEAYPVATTAAEIL